MVIYFPIFYIWDYISKPELFKVSLEVCVRKQASMGLIEFIAVITQLLLVWPVTENSRLFGGSTLVLW